MKGTIVTILLPRAEWNPRPARGSNPLIASEVEGIALHWPGMQHPITGRQAVASAIRGWQDYHMDVHGWSDIAYQAAVDQNGLAWELRGLTTRSAANGDQDVNHRFGALLLILAPGEQPTDAMARTTRLVISEFRSHYPNATKIVPHSAVRPDPTDCPGDIARAAIARGTFNPTATPTPGGPEMNAAEQAQMDRIEKGLAALSLAVANFHTGEANQITTLSGQEAGRYSDFVARYNHIMAELAKDPDSPVTPASVLPA